MAISIFKKREERTGGSRLTRHGLLNVNDGHLLSARGELEWLWRYDGVAGIADEILE